MKKIFIIILNFKSEDVIGDAVKSFDEDNVDIHILILDNGSTEETYSLLCKSLGEDIEIIRTKTNLGYSAGANYAVEYVRKKYDVVDYLFFFNPDAVATKNMLGVLCQGLVDNPSAAAISPLIFDMEGKNWFSGTSIEWDSCTINNNPDVSNPKVLREIDTFNGCAVLMDAQRFFEVGMFNEDMFIYYDEPFLSMEFQKKGYVSLYEPNSIAHHYISHSSGTHSTFKTHLMTRNHIYFFKKYGKSNNVFCPYLRPLRMIVYYLKRFMFSNIYYTLLGIRDSVIGKKGAP